MSHNATSRKGVHVVHTLVTCKRPQALPSRRGKDTNRGGNILKNFPSSHVLITKPGHEQVKANYDHRNKPERRPE